MLKNKTEVIWFFNTDANYTCEKIDFDAAILFAGNGQLDKVVFAR